MTIVASFLKKAPTKNEVGGNSILGLQGKVGDDDIPQRVLC